MIMRTMTAVLMLLLLTALPTGAQDLAGAWRVESVAGAEPPEGVSLTLRFSNNDQVTLTYTVADQPQSWTFTYAVADGRLTLAPARAFGEPQPVVLDIGLSGSRLELFEPEPEEPEEPEADDAEQDPAEGDEATAEEDADAATGEPAEDTTEAAEGDAIESDAAADDNADTPADAESDEATEEEEREPVWVLVRLVGE